MPTTDLTRILHAISPRYARVRTPAMSVLIHGAVFLLFLVLMARAFMGGGGVFAWGVGLAYLIYDTALLAFTARQTWRIGRMKAPAGGNVSVAVVIAAFNEAASLPRTLQALLQQETLPDLILVADDGSTDGTRSLAADFLTVRFLHLAHVGKAEALNAALAIVDTDVIVTVDADTLLDPGAIAAMRAAFAGEPGLVAATGVLSPVCGPGLIPRLFQWFQTYEYIRNFLSRFAWMRADGLLLISGAFAGFRRAALMEVGGFDTQCLVEDYELIHRLRRYGAGHGLAWTSRVLGACTARTDAPASLGAFLRQRRRWFGGFLQTQFWYRDMVGNPAYGRLGTAMLPVKAADTMQPIYGLSAFLLLIWYVAHGQTGVLVPVGGVILAKIGIDLGFHLWSVHLYRRWTGGRARAAFLPALLAAVVEPFSFQLLRHTGAALGWIMFLSGARGWGQQVRRGIVAAE